MPPENGTYGWYFTAGDDYSDDSDFFKPLHAARLEKYCPEVLPYLALPPGWRIIVGTQQDGTCNFSSIWTARSPTR
jgi:hypothetical protein